MIRKIKEAVDKFELSLLNRNVLTEAATGNFVVTPLIAALAGANVFAFTKASRHGSVADVTSATLDLAQQAGVGGRIRVVESLDEVPLGAVNIVTNTGHLRPIDSALIARLPGDCVVPLMWEPWEFRSADLDLDACLAKGIKVYGTNEEDARLLTKDYIGYLVLSVLLQHRFSPFSANVLLVGGDKFVSPVSKVLHRNNYEFVCVDGDAAFDLDHVNVVVLLENEKDTLLIDSEGKLYGKYRLAKDTFVLHVCGSVSCPNDNIQFFPEVVRPFGYMSLTPDQVDPRCVVDLHAAGLKVAEGMLAANTRGLTGAAYRQFMEINYPALAFDKPIYW